MRILAFDTSTVTSGLALVDRGELVAGRESGSDPAHSRRLLPLLGEMMAAAGWALGSIDLLAAAVGPGSFTGIRIGLATAQGLGLALGRPVTGVHSLEALAWLGREQAEAVVAVLEGGRDEVVAARFRTGGAGPGRDSEDVLLPPAEAFAALVRPGDLVIGEGAWRHRELLLRVAPGARPADRCSSAAEAVAVLAALAAAAAAAGEGALPAPVPVYLRRPDVALATSR